MYSFFDRHVTYVQMHDAVNVKNIGHDHDGAVISKYNMRAVYAPR